MKLEWVKQYDHDKFSDVLRFSGEVSMRDLERIEFNKLDRAVLDDCQSSNKAEDFLLALALIFRRYREQNEIAPNAAITGERSESALIGLLGM